MALMAEYIKYINSKSFTNNTKEAYISDCNMFLNYVQELNIEFYDIDNILVIKYLNNLKMQKKANSTITRNLSSINNLLGFMYKKKIIKEPVNTEFEIPIKVRPVPVTLTVEEVDLLLNTQDLTTFKGLRDKAMLELMYACGVKVSELLSLSIYDMDLDRRQLFLRKNNRKTRVIPIGKIALKYLKVYMKEREDYQNNNSDLVFFNLKGNKLTRQGFWKLIKEYSREANIEKNINTYTLRHSFAIHLIENGADITAVQRILGHKNLMATAIYKDVIDNYKIKEVYENSHPRAK